MTDEKKFCSKCKGILCSCGLDYSVSSSANAQKTDEKKWREWEIESFDHPDGNGEDTRRIFGPNTERVKVIEYAAYEKLQSEVELWRDKHKIVSDGFEKLDEHALELQSEVERLQLEVIKRNQYKINEEHLANVHKHYETLETKLQAAEAALRFERQAKQQRVLSVTLENAALREKLKAAEAIAQGMNVAGRQAYEGARRLAEALELVVEQFEDMQDSNDIQEHWHKIAREALTPEIRERYLK